MDNLLRSTDLAFAFAAMKAERLAQIIDYVNNCIHFKFGNGTREATPGPHQVNGIINWSTINNGISLMHQKVIFMRELVNVPSIMSAVSLAHV
jgi:hypothetical protein